MGQDSHWGLQAEMDYLDGLGSWTKPFYHSPMSRADLLRSYLQTIHLREPEPWTAEAVVYAIKLLREEE